MRVKLGKRILLRRRRSKRDYFTTPEEVTEGALQIWRTLPEQIRQDPSLASFRIENDRLHGSFQEPEADPLPNENDVNESDAKTKHVNITFPQIAINVTNPTGVLEREKDDLDPEDDREGVEEIQDAPPNKLGTILKWLKIIILVIVWCIFTVFLMLAHEHVEKPRLLTIPAQTGRNYPIVDQPKEDRLGVSITGAFVLHETVNDSPGDMMPLLTIQVQRLCYDAKGILTYTQNISQTWQLDLAHDIDSGKELTTTKTLQVDLAENNKSKAADSAKLVLHLATNIDKDLPLQVTLNESPIEKKEGVIYAAIVLCGLYIMIIWDIVHRTFAAIIASSLAIGILAALNARPSMETIMGWIDVETLLLLFGMMILVAILSETGVFDYLAVYAYKITNGHIWPLINCLCVFTAVLSSFLDNVTTVLLMTPVTIRLCEVMTINPVPILMCMVIYSNIGGALTPVGDPPNVIIASNSYISSNGINFTVFTIHMLPAVLLVMLTTYIQIRIIYRDLGKLKFKDSPEVEELKHEIKVWKRAAQSMSIYSKDEDHMRDTLLKKVNRLKRNLQKSMKTSSQPAPNYQQTLEHLLNKYPIRNKVLLIKSAVALTFVIGLFFLHSIPAFQRVSLGWTALLGAILLLILADIEDIETILARVEWSTLLFFAALFILMEALAELGLIEMIGRMTESVILGVGTESRLMVAILLILWVSAIASAFVDNIPLTTMMVKVTISLAQNETLGLPLQPLVWALALGACLGGNGTLIGASANVVCAGVAEQHGYKFTFLQFFKVGFPIMITSIIFSTFYLLIAHVACSWH